MRGVKRSASYWVAEIDLFHKESARHYQVYHEILTLYLDHHLLDFADFEGMVQVSSDNTQLENLTNCCLDELGFDSHDVMFCYKQLTDSVSVANRFGGDTTDCAREAWGATPYSCNRCLLAISAGTMSKLHV